MGRTAARARRSPPNAPETAPTAAPTPVARPVPSRAPAGRRHAEPAVRGGPLCEGARAARGTRPARGRGADAVGAGHVGSHVGGVRRDVERQLLAAKPAVAGYGLRAAGPERALLYAPAPLLDDDPPAGRDSFLESLMDTELYSMGAFFSDRHPELVDDVIARSEAIEDHGLDRYARTEGLTLEEGFQTLITGLAVRYYKAING
jgi:hypothetical protein